jgi:hypothetical protein
LVLQANIPVSIGVILNIGLENLRVFVENGGTVFSSSKGLAVLEAAGIVGNGVINKGKSITT